jgi:hypothetical protein
VQRHAREIGSTQDHVVTACSQIGDHTVVVGFCEPHRAARECAVASAQRQHLTDPIQQYPIAVGIREAFYMELVDHRILVPERV